MPDRRRDKMSDNFEYVWPMYARLIGVAGAFGDTIYSTIAGKEADVGFLAFCGSLIIVPWVARQQSRRNQEINGEKEINGNGHEGS